MIRTINNGKIFESNFKKSIPDDVYFYRYKDGTANWGDGSYTRFQASNKCDCELFYNGSLYNFELKSHKKKSIPLNCFRQNQIEELNYASKFGIYCGFVVEFSDLKKYYYLSVQKYLEFKKNNERLSIPISYFETETIEIRHKIKRIHPVLDIYSLLKDVKMWYNNLGDVDIPNYNKFTKIKKTFKSFFYIIELTIFCIVV